MIEPIAIAKSVAIPLPLAVVLGGWLRRGANRWCLFAAFAAGMLGAFSLNASLGRMIPSMLPPGQDGALNAREAWLSGFVEAAIPEEVAKGAWVLVFLVGWRRYSAGHGILLGGLVGLGFALRENLAYAVSLPEWRAMGALGHGAWGMILGGLCERARGPAGWRPGALAMAFLIPIALHGLADVSIFLVEAHERRTGLDLGSADPSALLSPALWIPMLTTVTVDLLSLAWALRLGMKIRTLQPEASTGIS